MTRHAAVPERTEALAKAVLDSAFRVHSTLGPGLLESVYEVCLCHELSKRDIDYERQVALPVQYDGLCLDAGLRLDVWVEKLLPVHTAQLMTYLKLTGNRLGLLINFNVPVIKDGIRRVVM